MLAPAELPNGFNEWNAKWHAPFGARTRLTRVLGETTFGIKARGPFAWQANNSTRRFEYPWVYQQVRNRGRGLRVAELGGGLSGLQFVLASEGDRVTNIDPGLKALGKGWALSATTHQRLSRVFHAPVELLDGTIDTVSVPPHSLDVLFSVSALEHFAPPDLAAFAQHVTKLLKPTGVAILTIDLFLDLIPFSRRSANEFGRNVDVRQLLVDAGLVLTEGDPRELFGFPEFDPQSILGQLPTYLVGSGYPALAQCIVAAPRRAA